MEINRTDDMNGKEKRIRGPKEGVVKVEANLKEKKTIRMKYEKLR